MSGHPSQAYLRNVCTDEVRDFVENRVEVGRIYRTEELWEAYNGRKGFTGGGPTFRYAMRKAGMELVGSHRLVKLPPDRYADTTPPQGGTP